MYRQGCETAGRKADPANWRVAKSVFVADDLFWYHPPRSLELAHALRKRGVRKSWPGWLVPSWSYAARFWGSRSTS